MPRRLTLAPHLTPDELEGRYRQCRDLVERTHWQMLWLVALGYPCSAVAGVVGYSDDWVRTIVRRYNDLGADGITDRRQANPGQTPLLTPALREELDQALAGPAPDGGLWTSPKVAAWLTERLGRPVAKQRAWDAMRRLGYTLQQPRTQAATADPAAQETFTKGGLSRQWRR